jgi:hypothetical protein
MLLVHHGVRSQNNNLFYVYISLKAKLPDEIPGWVSGLFYDAASI